MVVAKNGTYCFDSICFMNSSLALLTRFALNVLVYRTLVLLWTFSLARVLYITPSMVYDEPEAGAGGGRNVTGVLVTKERDRP